MTQIQISFCSCLHGMEMLEKHGTHNCLVKCLLDALTRLCANIHTSSLLCILFVQVSLTAQALTIAYILEVKLQTFKSF